MIQIEKTKLEGVLLIKSSQSFEDFRGEYIELWNKKSYDEMISKELGININFVEDDLSVTNHHSLKGIHGDYKTYKLISCVYGKFYLIVLNYDETSSEFGKWQGFTLSDKNRLQVLVPPKFGNGHVAISHVSLFHYKQSEYYDPKRQFTIKYNDPRFNIWWPVKNPMISRRDEAGYFVD